MSIQLLTVVCGLGFCVAGSRDAGPKPSNANWPAFRGPAASGIAEGFRTATTWNAEKGEHVLWKTAIPGLAHSSPIVWGDSIFVTTAVSSLPNSPLKIGLYGDGDSADDDSIHQWKVYCVDRRTGKIHWQRTAHSGAPRAKRHMKATQANTTPVTDGKRVIAFFGSEGMYCYDMRGKLLWKKDFGVLEIGPYDAPEMRWGYASSPILFENTVLVECDLLKDSFLAALDVRDGHEIWRTPRDDVATWSTPAVWTDSGRAMMIVNGWKHIGGYDARTGKEIWRMRGGGDIPVPTPVIAHGLIFIANAHGRMSPIYAVRPDATGDITLKEDETSNKYIAWCQPKNGDYLQTPLVYGDYVYSMKSNGVLNCYEALTGKQVYQERLGTGRTGFTSSPVAADGKVYFASEDGDVYVIQAGPQFKVLATNSMGEICMATPGISRGVLYYRTKEHLVAIGR